MRIRYWVSQHAQSAAVTNLLVERDEILPGPVRPRPTLHKCSYSKYDEYELKYCPTWVILVRGFDVARENLRARDFVE